MSLETRLVALTQRITQAIVDHQNASAGSGVHGADQIYFDPPFGGAYGLYYNVQEALQDAILDITEHLLDSAAAHPASAISVVPAGGISSAHVQAALQELDSEKQALDATLTALSALSDSLAADRVPYTTGVNTWGSFPITSAARGLLDDATISDMRTTLLVRALRESVNTITAAGAYAPVASDEAKHIQFNSGSAQSFVIPADATLDFATGAWMKIARLGAGTTTIDGSAVTMHVYGTAGAVTSIDVPRYAEALIRKRGADTWLVTMIPVTAVANDGWTYERLAADYTNSTISLTDIFTGFAPGANKNYEFEIKGAVLSPITTTGFIVDVAGPTGADWMSAKVAWAQSQTVEAVAYLDAFGAATTATSGLTTPAIFAVTGMVDMGGTPGAGNIRLRGRSEVAASTVTMKAGSYMRWRELV